MREAAHSADLPARRLGSPAGLSLEQIRAAAAEAGLDPILVERAAIRIAERGDESTFERAIGGPLRHSRTLSVPMPTSSETSARLLSTVRAAADTPGEGSADSSGFSWYGRYGQSQLSVTAHEEVGGTRIQVSVDRTRALVFSVIVSQLAIVMPVWILIESIDSYPELAALVAIPAGVLAAARGLWKSSTRSVRQRMTTLVDAMRESLLRGDNNTKIHDSRL